MLLQVVCAEDIKERLAEIDVFGGERREILDVYNPGIYEWKVGVVASPEYISTQQEDALRMGHTQQHVEQRFQPYDQQQQQQQTGHSEPQRPPRGEERQSRQQQQQQQQLQQQQLQQQQLQQQQLQQEQQRQQQQQQSGVVPPKAPPRRQKSTGDKQNTTTQNQVSYLSIHAHDELAII